MHRLEIDDPGWRAFVDGHPAAGPFHHPSWARLIADCYDFTAFALVESDESGALTSGLPMVETGGRLQRRAWISLPYSDYVPALVSPPSAGHAFVAAVGQHGRAADVGYIQVRAPVLGLEDHQHETDVIHALELGPDPDAVFARFHKMARRGVRKAEREGVTIRVGERRRDLTEVFYGLHLRTRRRLGSPVQPKRFFRLLWDRLLERGMGRLLIAYRGAEPIAAVVVLGWNGKLVYKFGASNPSALSYRPNHLLFWRMMQDGCRDGMDVLDLGRSDSANVGLREFKDRWGATERSLVYTTLAGGVDAPHAGHAPRVLQQLIRRSPPIVCRAAGELLYRFAA